MENFNLHQLILWAENDRQCRNSLDYLQRQVKRRKIYNHPVTVEHLADCSIMRKIVRRASVLVRQKDGRYIDNPTKLAARVHLAGNIIN